MTQDSVKPEDLPAAIKFLGRYRKLVIESGFCIHACGCCDSPWIAKLSPDDLKPDPQSEDSQTNLDRHFQHLSTPLKKISSGGLDNSPSP